MKTYLRILCAALLMVGIGATHVYAQTTPEAVCKGVVKDQAGQAVTGAYILQKGTSNGAYSQLDGSFTLNAARGSVLTVTFMGYISQEVTWNGVPLTIVLQEDNQLLQEVVVLGYGTQKKVNVTGAVSMIEAEALDSRPVANITNALQGAVPGLILTASPSGGDLNSNMKINIRGTGSIGSGSVDSPLVLIDGIEGDINLLNPNDVESVSVLKDAASASIYGSRAAFGVVMVSTKSGKAGKVRVNYSADVRFATATQVPDMANSLEYATFFNAANLNSGQSPTYTDETLERIKKFLNGEYTDPTQPEYYGTTANPSEGKWNNYGNAFANTDWFDEFYNKNVASTQHNLSLSGGSDVYNWSVSGSFLLHNGLIAHGHDQLNRYNLNAKMGVKLAPWAHMEYSSRWVRKDYEKPQYLTGLFFHNIARRWPTCPVIDPNGNYMAEMEIYELEDGGLYNEHNDENTQQLKFTLTPVKGWTIHADGAVRVNNNKYTQNQIPIYNYNVANEPMLRDSGYGTTSNASEERFKQNYYSLNLYTDFTQSWGLHNAKILAGLNYERFNQETLQGSGTNLTVENKPYISQTQKNFKASDAYWHRATAGYFARLNYDYDGKYLVEMNLRYDGSSRFLADKRWALFPSFSAGWNIAREGFFEPLSDKIGLLKLRASWGQLGNTSSNYGSFWDWYPFYQQQSLSSQSTGWLINGQKQNAASLPAIVNATMTWETIESWDLGLEWAAFNNRFTGTFDVYGRTTKDMIGPAPILGSILGANAPQTNNCDMRTNGWELELGWRDQVGDFQYGARFNLTDYQSKILSYPYEGDFDAQNVGSYYNGKVMGEIWGYESVGLASTREQMDSWIAQNKPNWGSGWREGDVMYKDQNGDGAVNSGANTLGDHGDLIVIGNSTPRYHVGLNLDAAWKGFDFSVFFQGVLKRDWMFGTDDPYFWGIQGNKWQSAGFKEHLDYWTEDNKGAYYPRPYMDNNKNHQASTGYVQNAAYLRCKNIQLGYTLPQSVLNKIKLANLRVYVSCDNLFTITKLTKVFDPEAFGSYQNSGWGSGKTYPLQRVVSMGVNLSF